MYLVTELVCQAEGMFMLQSSSCILATLLKKA